MTKKYYSEYRTCWDADISELKGKTLTKIERDGNDELRFFATDGSSYRMIYHPDCCASCSIEDICGDLDDLTGTPILLAEEVSSREPDEKSLADRKAEYEKEVEEYKAKGREPYYESFEQFCNYRYESETWTFYKLATVKGNVTIRWYGSSNGYYSESASFEQLTLDNDAATRASSQESK